MLGLGLGVGLEMEWVLAVELSPAGFLVKKEVI